MLIVMQALADMQLLERCCSRALPHLEYKIRYAGDLFGYKPLEFVNIKNMCIHIQYVYVFFYYTRSLRTVHIYQATSDIKG